MVEEHKERHGVPPDVAAKNKRLAIIRALIAAAFYLGFILLNMK